MGVNVCQRLECRTTAGCSYRGPHGEFCYFAGDFQSRKDGTPQLDETKIRAIVLDELIRLGIIKNCTDDV